MVHVTHTIKCNVRNSMRWNDHIASTFVFGLSDPLAHQPSNPLPLWLRGAAATGEEQVSADLHTSQSLH